MFSQKTATNFETKASNIIYDLTYMSQLVFVILLLSFD